MLRRFWNNYVQRHRHPANRWLHVLGVPLTFCGAPVALVCGAQLLALALFIAGYLLQFAGHAVEGNDAGELIVLKRWLGLPYCEFAPVWRE